MFTSNRLISAFFTALPGFLFLFVFTLRSSFGNDYWWVTYATVLLILLLTSALFGFALPPMFQKLRLQQSWSWIWLQGLLAWVISLAVLGLLNLTPLCISQNNGDGNNDLGMCMFMTALSGIVYTPVYLGLLATSAGIGHLLLSSRRPETPI